MTKPVLFISDLHLPNVPSPLRDTFGGFLKTRARSASALFILGDLFEYWTGDDIGLRDYADEARALEDLVASGVPVHFQHGNRDFLVGRQFAERTGITLLPDPCIVDLTGTPTVLSHGDVFCTGDVAYQRWRRFSRSKLVQWLYLRLPPRMRGGIAGRVRTASHFQNERKADDIMDVNDAAVAQQFRKQHVDRMIHGHTHRPADHDLMVDGRRCRRIVLADWRPGRCEALEVDEKGMRRVSLLAEGNTARGE